VHFLRLRPDYRPLARCCQFEDIIVQAQLNEAEHRGASKRPADNECDHRWFLSVTGGLAGIVLGVAFSWCITVIAGWRRPVSLVAITGGFRFSAAVGILFG
jgi:hypothetical protein